MEIISVTSAIHFQSKDRIKDKRDANHLCHSFILETFMVPLQEITTQRCSQLSHGQRRRTSESCKFGWVGHQKGPQLKGEM